MFNKFWHRVLAKCAPHISSLGSEQDSNSSVVHSGLQSSHSDITNPTGPLDLMHGTQGHPVDLDSETVHNLVSMAGSDNIDVAREGTGALAAVCNLEVNREKIVGEDLEGHLPNFLSVADVELRRARCLLLANLCQVESFRPSVISNHLQDLLEVVGGPASTAGQDAKRHAARCIEECCKTEAPLLLKQKCAKECLSILKRFSLVQDPHFRASIVNSLKCLEGCGAVPSRA